MHNSSADVITVNPTSRPLGSLYPEIGLARVRTRYHAEGTRLAREHSGRQLRMWFGSTGLKPVAATCMLVLRWIAAVALFVVVLPAMSGVMAVMTVLAALSLVSGTATRIICGGAAVGFALLACGEMSADLIPLLTLPSAAVLALIARIGPGRYSADAFIRRSLFRRVKRYQTRRLLANRFSYRAYQYANRVD